MINYVINTEYSNFFEIAVELKKKWGVPRVVTFER